MRIRLNTILLGCCLLALPTCSLAQMDKAPQPAVGTKVSPAETYSKLLAIVQKELVSAAEAMPADKYNFSPSQGEFKGVRTFGDQVKHIAQSNYYFFGSFTGAGDGAAIDKLTTKDEIVQALKDSLAMAQKEIDGITADNAYEMTKTGTRAGMTSFGLLHMMDHYGQMVVYLRMNGIVPPASRKQS